MTSVEYMDDHRVNICTLTPEIFKVWLDGYSQGKAFGLVRGRQDVEGEWLATMEISGEIAKQISRRGSAYAELLDARGEHQQAGAYRTLLCDRGIL